MKFCNALKAALAGMILPLTLSAETPTTDFAAASYSLDAQQSRIFELASEHGRFAAELLEPLQQLTRSQLEINRLEDAAENADYAIQIVRTTYGLTTPEQYDLQQLALDIDLNRQDWDAVNQRLEHYSGLILSEYYGTAADRVMRLLWLGNVHLRGAIEDDSEQEARHLRSATWYVTTAVAQAQKYSLENTRLYADMLYALNQRYFLEARAILDGGRTSYRLRQLYPGVHQVRDKFVALDRRYVLGLNALRELRTTLQSLPGYGDEAAALAEFYIADWKSLFDKSDDLDADYARAIDALAAAGVSAERIERYLAQPVAIPRPRLETRTDEVLQLHASLVHDGAQDQLLPKASLIEPSPQLAGFAQEVRLVSWQGSIDQDWAGITVSLTVDPADHVRVRNRAFRTKSWITASDVELQASELDLRTTEKALDRIKTLSFRPAFVDGKAVASELVLEYLVRDTEQPSMTPMVTENWVASFQAPGRSASLAAAGE